MKVQEYFNIKTVSEIEVLISIVSEKQAEGCETSITATFGKFSFRASLLSENGVDYIYSKRDSQRWEIDNSVSNLIANKIKAVEIAIEKLLLSKDHLFEPLSYKKAKNLIGKKIEWEVLGHNRTYKGVDIIISIDEESKLTTESIHGDDLKYAFLSNYSLYLNSEGNYRIGGNDCVYCYTDLDRDVFFRVVE